MKRYIVTDLTRFNKPDKVCTAVIDMQTRVCLRPMPYFLSEKVKEFNIHPGAILEGEIILKPCAESPHFEDASCKKLEYIGPASGDEFKAILDQTLSNSIASGFGIRFEGSQKHIPVGQQPTCSIITIKISPLGGVLN